MQEKNKMTMYLQVLTNVQQIVDFAEANNLKGIGLIKGFRKELVKLVNKEYIDETKQK